MHHKNVSSIGCDMHNFIGYKARTEIPCAVYRQLSVHQSMHKPWSFIYLAFGPTTQRRGFFPKVLRDVQTFRESVNIVQISIVMESRSEENSDFGT